MNPALDNYILQARAKGQTDEQIKQSLLQSGWDQAQINEAFGVPIPPLPVPVPPGAAGDFVDKKTKDTVLWSVVGDFIRSIIVAVAGAITISMFAPSINIAGYSLDLRSTGFHLDIGTIIISSLVGGIVSGLILAKLYDYIQKINRTYFNGWFNTLYRLIFYPSIIVEILSLVFTGGLSFSYFGAGLGGYFFMYAVVTVVASIVGTYIYAKLMVRKVGQYYA